MLPLSASPVVEYGDVRRATLRLVLAGDAVPADKPAWSPLVLRCPRSDILYDRIDSCADGVP